MKSILTFILLATGRTGRNRPHFRHRGQGAHREPGRFEAPIVLDTRGGYKDYFRGHLPTAHHLEFDTLRGTDEAVPVQYLPDDLTKALLVRAGVDKDRLHLVYATGDVLPNDEILSTTMVVYVLGEIRRQRHQDRRWRPRRMEEAGASHRFRTTLAIPPAICPRKAIPDVAANIDDVQAHVGKSGNLLIDARPLNEFRGEDDVWLRKGHIPGAISFHWARLMEKDNTHKFKPFAEVKAELEGRHHARQKHHRLLRHLARRQPAHVLPQARRRISERAPLRRRVEGIRLAEGQIAACRDGRRSCGNEVTFGCVEPGAVACGRRRCFVEDTPEQPSAPSVSSVGSSSAAPGSEGEARRF
jgi:3-mercaptopyruvate sulfurtransferase SseA